MKTDEAPMTYQEVMNYAEQTGKESAADLLLLRGPDGYAGTYEEYNELLYILTGGEGE